MKLKSRKYRGKSLTTNKYVYGALEITTGYYAGYAIIHMTEVIPEVGEEDVGGWEFLYGNAVVDIKTVQEKVSGKWVILNAI
jgi:hypothetical protein